MSEALLQGVVQAQERPCLGGRQGAMRDPMLNEALRRLAAEAATRFTTLVAGGDQIPFDVAESAGPDESFFHSYVPLTGRYVLRREDELRTLPSFETAREAVDAAGVAATYLELRGEEVPADAAERAARMLTVFLAGLWDGCSDFALDRERLDGALAVLEAEAGDADEAEFVAAPLAGMRLPLARLRLPHGVQIVRDDVFEAPIEARRSEGMGRDPWERQFFAIAELGEEDGSAATALRQLHELVTVLHLFKAGGVGLGPFAYARAGEGGWRRMATGAAAARPGGYQLDEEECERLAEFAKGLEAQPDPGGPLAWAANRFELGCQRANAREALSDHLLALRAVLDGQGPVGASLPMRAAALVASGSEDRHVVRERIEAAQQLERAQMAGGAVVGAAELAEWVEGGVRRILREAALGELGTDLNTAADETLIAAGLNSGDIDIAVSVEGLPGMPGSEAEDMPATTAKFEEEDDMDQDTRILEPVPAMDEIRISATNWLQEVEADERIETSEATLDFPAIEGEIGVRERIDTPRVRHLFPVPEDADWQVRELNYSHYRRTSAG